jgi:hypothetical protein
MGSSQQDTFKMNPFQRPPPLTGSNPSPSLGLGQPFGTIGTFGSSTSGGNKPTFGGTAGNANMSKNPFGGSVGSSAGFTGGSKPNNPFAGNSAGSIGGNSGGNIAGNSGGGNFGSRGSGFQANNGGTNRFQSFGAAGTFAGGNNDGFAAGPGNSGAKNRFAGAPGGAGGNFPRNDKGGFQAANQQPSFQRNASNRPRSAHADNDGGSGSSSAGFNTGYVQKQQQFAPPTGQHQPRPPKVPTCFVCQQAFASFPELKEHVRQEGHHFTPGGAPAAGGPGSGESGGDAVGPNAGQSQGRGYQRQPQDQQRQQSFQQQGFGRGRGRGQGPPGGSPTRDFTGNWKNAGGDSADPGTFVPRKQQGGVGPNTKQDNAGGKLGARNNAAPPAPQGSYPGSTFNGGKAADRPHGKKMPAPPPPATAANSGGGNSSFKDLFSQFANRGNKQPPVKDAVDNKDNPEVSFNLDDDDDDDANNLAAQDEQYGNEDGDDAAGNDDYVGDDDDEYDPAYDDNDQDGDQEDGGDDEEYYGSEQETVLDEDEGGSTYEDEGEEGDEGNDEDDQDYQGSDENYDGDGDGDEDNNINDDDGNDDTNISNAPLSLLKSSGSNSPGGFQLGLNRQRSLDSQDSTSRQSVRLTKSEDSQASASSFRSVGGAVSSGGPTKAVSPRTSKVLRQNAASPIDDDDSICGLVPFHSVDNSPRTNFGPLLHLHKNVGICVDMCPPEERLKRDTCLDIHKLETIPFISMR